MWTVEDIASRFPLPASRSEGVDAFWRGTGNGQRATSVLRRAAGCGKRAADMTWTTNPRVEKILSSYPDKRSAVMPLLYLAMSEYGYLTDEAIREVAGLVGMTSVQVSSVATFYTMYKREEVGRYLLSV